jgi:iron-sulfur-dependent L-serine dehydratase single chain form
MAVSVFDLFKIGIGPSSSHTVGPMRAARLFVLRLQHEGLLERTARVMSQLYGSLGATGKGHGSDKAVLLGLMGHEPDTVEVDAIPALLDDVRRSRLLVLDGAHEIAFQEREDLKFHRRETLPLHTNGMRFTAFDTEGTELLQRVYYSVGGGFVLSDEVAADGTRLKAIAPDTTVLPHTFHSGADLLRLTRELGCSIAGLMRRNERHWRSDAGIDAGLLRIWQVMQDCVARGCAADGVLPGGFQVRRRAKALREALVSQPEAALRDPLQVLDWVNLYALAVNEENAAGGRVVTAPTNGAAGIVPAVLHYYRRFVHGASDAGVIDLPAHGGGHRHPLQGERQHQRCRGGLPGRGRRGLQHGRGRPVRRARRHARAGRERRRDRHGAPPGPDLRPGGRAGADSLHRAQRHRLGQGHQRRAHGPARRRHPPRESGPGHQDHARDRCRHDDQVQGDGARRAGGEHRRVLSRWLPGSTDAPQQSPAGGLLIARRAGTTNCGQSPCRHRRQPRAMHSLSCSCLPAAALRANVPGSGVRPSRAARRAG